MIQHSRSAGAAERNAQDQPALFHAPLSRANEGVVRVVGLSLLDELPSLITGHGRQRPVLDGRRSLLESGQHCVDIELSHMGTLPRHVDAPSD